jgi:hypothetical protein
VRGSKADIKKYAAHATKHVSDVFVLGLEVVNNDRFKPVD